MKCYYEELGLQRDANDGDIKSAYRKLALRWHPDKNPDALEQAKERFQLIQQAYEVLSDAQERAWYDNHREQILRGKSSDYVENCLDLFQYFTVGCFKGYGDDAKGFYAVFRDVFEKIAVEDAEFMDNEEELTQIPKFGDSQSSYDEVVGPFYAHWQAYCTKKTYTWLCPYDIQDIKDRRILREIEKDMKKVVQKAKKERNEEVRNLVSFVRKRDKRVQAYKRQLEERAELNRQKQIQNRHDQIRKRQQELQEMRKSNNHTFNDGYEEQLKQLELQYDTESSSDDAEKDVAYENDSDNAAEHEESYVHELYCVACNRAFRNPKAFANHESSKKHRDNIDRLRQEMQSEEDAYNEASEETASDNNDEAEETSLNIAQLSTEENEQTIADEGVVKNEASSSQLKKQRKKSKRNNKTKGVQPFDVDDKTDSEANEVECTLQHPELGTDTDNGDDAENNWSSARKKGARKAKNKKPPKNHKTETPTTTMPHNRKPTTETETTTNEVAASAYGTTNAASATTPLLDAATVVTTHICATCNSTFGSKNKLFAHLKITNHGVYLPKGSVKVDTTTGHNAAKSVKKAKGKRK